MDDILQSDDFIYPPTKEQIEDLRTHNIGAAIRLSSKLGRPLESWEYEIFRKLPTGKTYKIKELSNGRFGIAV
jgi:hypothetical protein